MKNAFDYHMWIPIIGEDDCLWQIEKVHGRGDEEECCYSK